MLDEERVVYLRDHATYPPGCETMRLRLVYSGPLPSRGREGGQWDRKAEAIQTIRKHFHPQLRRFWETNRTLRAAKAPGHASLLSPHGAADLMWKGPGADAPLLVEHTAQNFRENGYRFVPLVCEDWSLSCALHVLFLRRDPPGAVVTHGDLDNRMKSLIDALRKPQGAQELGEFTSPAEGEDPFFVLLQDDKLVDALEVETGELLTPPEPGRPESDCHLVVTATIRPFDVNVFNLGFA